MNIKLAEKVLGEKCFVKEENGEIWFRSKKPDGNTWIVVDWHYDFEWRKLIEWLAKQIQNIESYAIPTVKYDIGKARELAAKTSRLDQALRDAIATNDTDKLVEIAESLLDKGECCE